MALTLSHLAHEPEGHVTAPTLLIAHGLFGSARNFNTLGRKLAVDRRVVIVDMRNHGDSPWSDEMDYPAMAEDLADAVEQLCGGSAVVLGHSMGGKAAMALALIRPEVLDGLIVADIAPVAYPHSHTELIRALLDMDLSAVTRRSDADGLLAPVIPEPMLRAFLLQNLVVEGGAARWRLNLQVLDVAMPALTGWPVELDRHPYNGAAFFLYGGSSSYMSPVLVPRVRELFQDAVSKSLPGAGHWLHAEQPDAFLAAVRNWLARL